MHVIQEVSHKGTCALHVSWPADIFLRTHPNFHASMHINSTFQSYAETCYNYSSDPFNHKRNFQEGTVALGGRFHFCAILPLWRQESQGPKSRSGGDILHMQVNNHARRTALPLMKAVMPETTKRCRVQTAKTAGTRQGLSHLCHMGLYFLLPKSLFLNQQKNGHVINPARGSATQSGPRDFLKARRGKLMRYFP